MKPVGERAVQPFAGKRVYVRFLVRTVELHPAVLRGVPVVQRLNLGLPRAKPVAL